MKKCCGIILTAIFMLAFVTTTLASDVVLEFYLQTGDSSIVPIKNIHCMLLDSNHNTVLDKSFEDETVCKVPVALEEGDYSLIVETPVSHNFGNMNIRISSESSPSMLFLLDNLELKPFEGVHSCEHNLACVEGAECVCDESCVCRQIHNKASLKFVGQSKESVVSNSHTPLQKNIGSSASCPGACGQPAYSSSYGYSNLYRMANGPTNGAPAARGAWGLLGALGFLAFIKGSDPGPISESPVYK